ncbi:hypothetical protein Hdeb2414_s0007g00233841 [Helianthus debilis subsp. tardiflorus]
MILFSHGSTFPLPSLSSLSQLTSHRILFNLLSLASKHIPTIRVLVRTATITTLAGAACGV